MPRIKVYKYLIETSLWTLARFWVFWFKHGQISTVAVFPLIFDDDGEWWLRQIEIINRKYEKRKNNIINKV